MNTLIFRYLSFFIIVTLLTTSQILPAQSYKTAVGFRLGKQIMLSVSQRIVKKSTLDLYHESSLFSEQMFTALAYKKHFPLVTKRLNVFLGGGPYHHVHSTGMNSDVVAASLHGGGLMGTVGLDFTLGRFNIGYDIMPLLRVAGQEKGSEFSTRSGITVRYVIVKQPSKIKSWFTKRKRS